MAEEINIPDDAIVGTVKWSECEYVDYNQWSASTLSWAASQKQYFVGANGELVDEPVIVIVPRQDKE